MLFKFAFLCVTGFALATRLRNTTVQEFHGNSSSSSYAALNSAPCQCQANNAYWKPTARTVPKCIFIDLGAANGNSFQQFLQNSYGPIYNCPSGQWEAILVEANPQFTPYLDSIQTQYQNQVHSYSSTAAYMCQGRTSFSIDPDAAHNHWGSSMKREFGGITVTVPTVNVIQLIAENTIHADWVILKVDIEGAEYDILPCLANYPNVRLIDRMYLEEHNYLQANSVYTKQQYTQAKATLQALGVDMPQYYSHTL